MSGVVWPALVLLLNYNCHSSLGCPFSYIQNNPQFVVFWKGYLFVVFYSVVC